jgi:uncharacterized protein YbjT (DUF2867 family)
MRIVVNTPTGNIGRSLVQTLLARGAEVTLIARSPEKVRDFAERGARVVEGSIDDAAVLEKAFEGAGGLFWLAPPAFRPDWRTWGPNTAKQAAEIAKKHGIKRVVVLSSVGAQNGPGSGPVGTILAVEEAFRAVAPDVTALRAGFFMENILQNLDTIVKAGAIFSPLPADAKGPGVATKDIAAVAAEELLGGAPGHRIRGVHGPADISGREQAEILSTLLRRPIAYVEVPVEAAEKGMADAGLPPFAVEMFGEMYRGVLVGKLASSEPRSAETTTPTTFAEFAAEVVRPAVLAKLPQFLVTFDRKAGVSTEEVLKVLPAERAHYGELVKEGVVKHGFFAADGKRAFVVIASASPESAEALMKAFPLAPLVDIGIIPLATPA